MLAVFNGEIFIGIWQEQMHENSFVERTAQALGLNVSNIVVMRVPQIPNNKSYYFNDEKQLIFSSQVNIGTEEEPNMAWQAEEPQTLEQVYPNVSI